MEPTHVTVEALPHAVFLAPYIRMTKAGMPIEVIRQRMSIDVQIKDTDPVLDPITTYLQGLREGKDDPEPDLSDFKHLMSTVHSRLQDKAVKTQGYIDYRLRTEAKRQAGELTEKTDDKQTELNGYIGIYASEGAASGDKTVGAAVDEVMTESELRALHLRDEAYGVAARRIKEMLKDAETTLGAVDEEALTISSKESTIANSTEHLAFCSAGLFFPAPEIISERTVIAHNLTALKSTVPNKMDVTQDVVVKEHLPVYLYTFTNVLSTEECDNLVKEMQFNKIEENMQERVIIRAKEAGLGLIRNNIRRTVVDESIARLVWSCIKTVCPESLEDGRRLAGVRTKMFFYKYSPGQFFTTHLDGGHRFRNTGETSEYTFVLYLTDDFEGGETRFCPQQTWIEADTKSGASFGGVRQIKPVKGGMSIFRQRDVKHCGVTLSKGYKYILQGMIMYGPVKYNKHGTPVGVPPMDFTQTHC